MKVTRVTLLALIHFLHCFLSKVTAYPDPDVGIHWRDLTVQTSSNITLLHSFSGFVANGELCGIIGPSGSGKSTLLHILGGRSNVEHSGHIWLQGTIDQRNVSPTSVAFLLQQDKFFHMLTTAETLKLAAFLEFPAKTKRQRDTLVQTFIDKLGLSHVQDRKVGDRSLPGAKDGLSGGEQRRLSLALVMMGRPRLFLADEATTGLDSSQAIKVVRLISDLAKEYQIPALLSMHQPRASIWKKLDKFILLGPGGKVCYMGKRVEALSYFQELGYKCPEETNPAEFFIDLVTVDTEDTHQGQKDELRIESLMVAFQEHSHAQMSQSTYGVDKRTSSMQLSRRVPTLRRFAALLRRSWRQNIRNTHYNFLRLGASIGNALLFSQIFASIKHGLPLVKSIADRTALLSFGVINMSMMALMKTIHLFSRERPVVGREQGRQQYGSFEYLLSKAFAEIPFDTLFGILFTTTLKLTTSLRISWRDLTAAFSLMTVAGASLGFAVGSWSDSADTAMAIGVPLMVIFMVVGIINPSGVDSAKDPPQLVTFLQQASPIKWAIEAMCVAEYKGMDLREGSSRWGRIRDLPKMGAFSMVQNGDQILEALGLQESSYTSSMRHLALISAANLLLSWFGLERSQLRSRTAKSTRGRNTMPKNVREESISDVEESHE